MLKRRTSRIVTDVLLAAIVSFLCLVTLETGFRLLDGYRLDRLTLEAKGAHLKHALPDGPDATDYASRIRLDPTFDPAWFHTSPPDYDRSPKYELPTDWVAAVANYRASLGEPPFVQDEFKFLFNYNMLATACAIGTDVNLLRFYEKYPGFVYAFASPDSSGEPPYRVVPRGWVRDDYYNNFGFRGPDIVPRKTGRVIRIAFLDSSVTAAGWPFTYPEYVVHYLRLWAQTTRLDLDFDLINAARSGVGSPIIAKIMRYEVAALHPDIVVYYDGGEEVTSKSIVRNGSGSASAMKQRQHYPFEQYSATLSRLHQLLGYGVGVEPPKPAHTLTFDLTQKDPDLDREDLPFLLHRQILNIRDAADATRSIGGEFFLASYIGIAQDGLRLDPDRYRQKGILQYLNDESNPLFPLTYQEIRQGLDFENAVYRKLAQADHYGFLDLDRYFPQDPDFFGDLFHMPYTDGYRLMAWIIAQELTPYLRDAISRGSLPTPAYEPDPKAIAWASRAPIKFDLSCFSKWNVQGPPASNDIRN